MTEQHIDYGNLMQRAMRSLVVDVLDRVAREGLPGAHHFFITFDTRVPGVEIADWLRERYPDDMTIVIQNWFEDLEVDADRIGITLNFGDTPERLVIPLDAIRTFVDPSVEFGLRFESHDTEDEEPEEPEQEARMAVIDDDADEADHHDAEVVSLDAFRKT